MIGRRIQHQMDLNEYEWGHLLYSKVKTQYLQIQNIVDTSIKHFWSIHYCSERLYLHIVAGQEKPHMCIWPLNLNLLSNKKENRNKSSFIHVAGPQLNQQKPFEHVLN